MTLANEQALQKALHGERRALDRLERVKTQCRSQAALMTLLFSTKLTALDEIVQEALNGGERAELETKLERFRASVAWIGRAVEAGTIDGQISKEIQTLRNENERLAEALQKMETSAIEAGSTIVDTEPAGAEMRIRELERQCDTLREDLKLTKAKALELEHGTGKVGGGRDIAGHSISAESPDLAVANRELSSLRETVARLEVGDASGAVAEMRASMELERKENKSAIKKLKARNKELEATSEREKEELMTAMEKEVETLIAEEREKFEKEKERLERSAKKASKATKSQAKTLTKLAKQVALLKPEIARCREEAKEHLRHLPAVSRSVAQQIAVHMDSVQGDLVDLKRRYQRELTERKRLHNLVQELRGNIRVFCRVRPPSKREKEHGGPELAECVSFPNDGEIKVVNGRKEKTWSFDRVFQYSSSQSEVYSEVSELVTSVLDGYNVCIFAYGQTGSGKTYTMTGPPEDRGCNLRALNDLFLRSNARRGEVQDVISVSIMEVYNEQIRDLLAPSDATPKKLEVRRGEAGNFVPDLTTVTVQGDEEVLELMEISDKARSQASTEMNEQSSRSHMLMSVLIESKHLANGNGTRGRLHLVDLAGSERIDKSGATGQALKEAQNINKSLSALGDVISARAHGAGHIPFRNSTLTHLLQDSLSQDSKTLMFCCVSPVLYNADETVCTLNFASRVGTVELGKASKNVTGGPVRRK